MANPAPVRLRLRPAMRLRQKHEFTDLRQAGRRLVRGCLAANWKTLPPGSLPRLGVITGRKLGKAHVRSRARRLLRETFRLHQHEFEQPVAMVLVARSSILGRKRADVERDFLAILREASLLKAKR